MAEAQTFLFADLAGFTALTEAHGDERAADLIADFTSRVRAILPTYDSREVKTIGDALLLRSPDAVNGIRLGLELARNVGGRHAFPGVRVGIHTGPAVEREEDWFGAAVNLASRVSGAASAGEVLVTDTTLTAAQSGGLQDEFSFRGTRRFKNVRVPVRLYAIQAAEGSTTRDLAVDPVCRMSIDAQEAPPTQRFRAVTYHFCSTACEQAFLGEPEHYHRQQGSRAHLRASEDARERAVTFLRRAYERGRIDLEELDERLAHTFVAKTRGELRALVSDLPGHRKLRRSRKRSVFRPPWRRGSP